MEEMTFEKLQRTMSELRESEYGEVYKYYLRLREEEIEKERQKLFEREWDEALRCAVFHYRIEPVQPTIYFPGILV